MMMTLKRRTRLGLSLLLVLPLLITVAVLVTVVATVPAASSSPSPSPETAASPQVATAAAVAFSAPPQSTPPGWVRVSVDGSGSRAPPSAAHSFRWLFPHCNVDWLLSELELIANPSHARYQNYKTRRDILAMMGPSDEQRRAVLTWLAEHAVQPDEIADYGDALHVTVDAERVEAMFNVSLHRFVNPRTNQTATRAITGTAHLPAHLAPMLAALRGVYEFPHPVTKASVQRRAAASPTGQRQSNFSHVMHTMQMEVNQQCPVPDFNSGFIDQVLAPASLASAYNFALRDTDSTPQATRTMVVTGLGGEAYSPADLQQFRRNIGFSAPVSVAEFPNTANNANFLSANGVGLEANLDVQAVFQASPTTNLQIISADVDYDLEGTLTYVASMPASVLPHVLSISYFFSYSDYAYLQSVDYRTETLLATLGAMGVTVVASSGDDGADGYANRGCSPNVNTLGYGLISPFTTPMLPMYPAASPYVLSVGESSFTLGIGSLYNSFTQTLTSPPECNNCPADQPGQSFFCQDPLYPEEPISTASASQNANRGQVAVGQLHHRRRLQLTAQSAAVPERGSQGTTWSAPARRATRSTPMAVCCPGSARGTRRVGGSLTWWRSVGTSTSSSMASRW